MQKADYKILSKMFETELTENYNDSDVEGAQISYLCGGNFSLDKLISYSAACLPVVLSTLCILYDTPDIASFTIFPFVKFADYIINGDLQKIQITLALCKERPNFYINLLYTVVYKIKNDKKGLAALSVLLEPKEFHRIFEQKQLWGLSRERVGVVTELDKEVNLLVAQNLLDITQVNRVSNSYTGRTDVDLFADSREALHYPGLITISKHLLKSKGAYQLPFFLGPLFELCKGFEENEEITKTTVFGYQAFFSELSSVLAQLFLNQVVKENFCDLVKNVCSQDRRKLVFDPETNCSNSFCYSLFYVFLNVAKGIFNNGFIPRIGVKKFPTFCFFYLSKALSISLLKLLYDIKENYNSKNSFELLYTSAETVLSYLNFVFDLIHERQDEVFSPLYEYQSSKARISIEEAKDIVKTCTTSLDLSLESKDAESVKDILYDESFLTPVLDIYTVYCKGSKSKSFLTLINNLFVYTNVLKYMGIHVLRITKTPLNQVLVNRLIYQFSNYSGTDEFGLRYLILDVISNYNIEINNESLRMISKSLGLFEDEISGLFKTLKDLNALRQRKQELESLLNGSSEMELSDDEEQVKLLPDSFISLFENRPDDFIKKVVKERWDERDADKIFLEIKTRLTNKNNPFKLQVYRKIRVNDFRNEIKAKNLKSIVELLNTILHFLKIQTKINKKLFLNKIVFFRLFSVLNSSFDLLLGENSKRLKIANKKDFNLEPKDILSSTISIVVNVLKDNKKLSEMSNLNIELVKSAYNLASTKCLIPDETLKQLKFIINVLEETTAQKAAEDFNFDDIPEEFLDPLTFTLMLDPVIMTTSRISIDRTTFNQIMLNDRTDPFSRMPIDESKIQANLELKEKISCYMKEKGIKK